MDLTIPTGNTTEAVTGYYNYLFQQYYHGMHINRPLSILWMSPITAISWGAILILFFGLYAMSLNRAHRRYGEMYQSVSFAGSLLERNGEVSVFTWTVIIGLFTSALYLGIRSIFFGFLY